MRERVLPTVTVVVVVVAVVSLVFTVERVVPTVFLVVGVISVVPAVVFVILSIPTRRLGSARVASGVVRLLLHLLRVLPLMIYE